MDKTISTPVFTTESIQSDAEKGGYYDKGMLPSAENVELKQTLARAGYYVVRTKTMDYLTGTTPSTKNTLWLARSRELKNRYPEYKTDDMVLLAMLSLSLPYVLRHMGKLLKIFSDKDLLKVFLSIPLNPTKQMLDNWFLHLVSIGGLYDLREDDKSNLHITKLHRILEVVQTVVAKLYEDEVRFKEPPCNKVAAEYKWFRGSVSSPSALCISELLKGKVPADDSYKYDWQLNKLLRIEHGQYPFLLCARKPVGVNDTQLSVKAAFKTIREALAAHGKSERRTMVVLNDKCIDLPTSLSDEDLAITLMCNPSGLINGSKFRTVDKTGAMMYVDNTKIITAA